MSYPVMLFSYFLFYHNDAPRAPQKVTQIDSKCLHLCVTIHGLIFQAYVPEAVISPFPDIQKRELLGCLRDKILLKNKIIIIG